MEELVRFSKRADFWCTFSWSICDRKRPLHWVIQRRRLQGYDDTHTHGKTSAERNTGRKPKFSERDRRTLKRTMSENYTTTAAKVTKELNIHPADPLFTQKKSDESVTNPTSTIKLQLLNLSISKITLKSEKCSVMIVKPGSLKTDNT